MFTELNNKCWARIDAGRFILNNFYYNPSFVQILNFFPIVDYIVIVFILEKLGCAWPGGLVPKSITAHYNNKNFEINTMEIS